MLNDTFKWLNQLIGCNTTSSNSNLTLIEIIKDYLQKYQLTTTIIYNQEKNKANLLATLPASNGNIQGGIMLSGHTDVVPVSGQNWHTDPFNATLMGNNIFGRGTSDMKGFLAVILALIPEFKKNHLCPPIHFAFSFDEEVGCRGIGSLIDAILKLNLKPKLCIVGEPTNMDLVVAHKGIQTYRCHLQGLAKHSSLTPYGCNTIDYAASIVHFLRELATNVKNSGPHDQDYDIPFTTISTNIIHGGIVHNMIPENCEVTFEFRNLPEVDPATILTEITSYLSTLQSTMRNEYSEATITLENISASPSFNSSLDLTAPPIQPLLASKKIRKVAYATEAGYFEQVGIKTLICGPGSIEQAHQANEFITTQQLQKCETFLRTITNTALIESKNSSN